ncbi:cytokine receptor family member B16 [Polypterus senegalus]|uniref:cytokine receptor family member B16 n=1 Tax=Polypterus senegalus TaxID=55291 RepID=UPI0019632555|nr:cytokine receptor family member B16 [Polypterus senegalus]
MKTNSETRNSAFMFLPLLLQLLLSSLAFLKVLEKVEGPKNVHIISTDMTHLLLWSPVPASKSPVNYSVQYQGEHEREYKNGTWEEVEECTGIGVTICDVTKEISSNVYYSFRVMAIQEGRMSDWETIEHMFKRNQTFLTTPQINITDKTEFVRVQVKKMPKSIVYIIRYWQQHNEDNIKVATIPWQQTTYDIIDIVEHSTICLQAQTYSEVIHRSSNFSEVQCVHLKERRQRWDAILTAGVLAILVPLMVLCVLGLLCRFSSVLKHSVCPVEHLPDTLDFEYFPEKIQRKTKEASEYCEPIMVLSMENNEITGLLHTETSAEEKRV